MLKKKERKCQLQFRKDVLGQRGDKKLFQLSDLVSNTASDNFWSAFCVFHAQVWEKNAPFQNQTPRSGYFP